MLLEFSSHTFALELQNRLKDELDLDSKVTGSKVDIEVIASACPGYEAQNANTRFNMLEVTRIAKEVKEEEELEELEERMGWS